MRRLSSATLLLLAACGGEIAAPQPDGESTLDLASAVVPLDAAVVAPDASSPNDAAVDATVDAARLAAGTYLLTLDAGAFPPTKAHPSALVYVPSGFDPTPPIALVVYLHGWNNCVENVVRDAGQSCDRDAGTPARQAYGLAAQLEASGKNALLLCPEVVFDQPTGNPGNLGASGGFRALLDETLRALAPQLGQLTAADVDQVAITSHSGGYGAAAAIATRGGVTIDEIYLLDSLYGNSAEFDAWVKKDLVALAGASPRRRFADVYTAGGGTLANSRAMADRAAKWFPPDAGVVVDDRTTATWLPATYAHGLLFKFSSLAHDGVPRYYFGTLVSSSALPGK